jgi:nucleotide-binding universal stress UspA family protein
MNPGLVLGMLSVLAAALVIVVGVTMFRAVRRPWRLSCPRDGRDARVQVDRASAVRAEVFGGRPRVARCSLWPVLVCGERCLDMPAGAHRPVAPGEVMPPSARRRTILVPLDGSRGSEAVLPTARVLALEPGRRVRLLRVMKPVECVRDEDERIIAYLDQEAATAEAAARDYLRRVEIGLGGFEVESVVRFGDPAHEILREAERPDVAFIAMAARQLAGRRHSVTTRVAREAWVPVVRTAYGAAMSEAVGR